MALPYLLDTCCRQRTGTHPLCRLPGHHARRRLRRDQEDKGPGERRPRQDQCLGVRPPGGRLVLLSKVV
jgi:hypothetical protein